MSPAQGSYFGLSAAPRNATEPPTPFFTPMAYPATPNPPHAAAETSTENQHEGFAAALRRNDTLKLPSRDTTPRKAPARLPQTPSATSGATPFFSDLSIHSGQMTSSSPDSQQTAPSPRPKVQDQKQPDASSMRRTSSASALPAAAPVASFKQPSLPVKRPSTASSTSDSSFPSLSPAEVQPPWFFDQRDSTLVLDLRTHSAFLNHNTGRLKGSINLCVPTTLLRRPNHNLGKLADSLPVKHQREALLDILNPSTRLQRVIAIDQDTVVLAPTGPLYSILSKVARERAHASQPPLQLFWLQGGVSALAKESKISEAGLLLGPGFEEESDGHSSSEASLSSLGRTDSELSDQSSSATSVHSSDSSKSVESNTTTLPPILQVRSLPMSAFDNTSTQQFKNAGPTTSGTGPGGFNLPQTSHRVAANPFFDAIRQNREVVDFETSLKNVHPLQLSPRIEDASEYMPPFLKTLVESSPTQRAERLVTEYHELESLEQRRLTDLMEWHSDPRHNTIKSAENPLSISAGVEKGHLNRYRHIFPYEHTRCRLQSHHSSETDYINASHIRFRSSQKHYIASQGPLAAATNDFWQLVWQEQIGVVVMLTHLREGGLEKCHRYFDNGTYGTLRITQTDHRLDQQQGPEIHPDSNEQQSFFSAFDLNRTSGTPAPSNNDTLRRTLLLEELSKSSGQSTQKPQQRKVEHFQFGNWPDFDIPPDADTLISFIKDVNQANRQISAENGLQKPGPVLVHCSAGVGRTGCFMLIDTLLDRLEHAANGTASTNLDLEPTDMVLDEPHAPPPQAGHSGFDSQATPPLLRPGPVFAAVNEMREQRMSMVANLAQYQFIHTAVMHGLSKSLTTPTLDQQARSQPHRRRHHSQL